MDNRSIQQLVDSLGKKMSALEQLPKCTISMKSIDELTDPVLAPDGQIYEKKDLKKWLATHANSPVVPSFKMSFTECLPAKYIVNPYKLLIEEHKTLIDNHTHQIKLFQLEKDTITLQAETKNKNSTAYPVNGSIETRYLHEQSKLIALKKRELAAIIIAKRRLQQILYRKLMKLKSSKEALTQECIVAKNKRVLDLNIFQTKLNQLVSEQKSHLQPKNLNLKATLHAKSLTLMNEQNHLACLYADKVVEFKAEYKLWLHKLYTELHLKFSEDDIERLNKLSLADFLNEISKYNRLNHVDDLNKHIKQLSSEIEKLTDAECKEASNFADKLRENKALTHALFGGSKKITPEPLPLSQTNLVDSKSELLPERQLEVDINLYSACYNLDLPSIILALEAGANPNYVERERKQTPLIRIAAECMKIEALNISIATVLLSKKADVNARDYRNDTALHWAANRGNLPLVKFLIAYGADINLRNNDNKTPKQDTAYLKVKDYFEELEQERIHDLLSPRTPR